jgi:hypothetical protein
MVTLLEESSGPQAVVVDSDPLAWSLSDQEQAVWDELPEFRAEHPVQLLRTTSWTTPRSQPPIVGFSGFGGYPHEQLDV